MFYGREIFDNPIFERKWENFPEDLMAESKDRLKNIAQSVRAKIVSFRN